MKKTTNKVTAWVSGGTPKTMIFIYQGTTPTKYPKITITQGNNQLGVTGGRLEDYLEVKVTDGNGRALSGVAVKFDDPNAEENALFIPVPGTKVYGTNVALTTTLTAPGTHDLVDSTKDTTTAQTTGPQPNTTIFVQTDSNGVAKTHYQLSDADVDTTTRTLVQTITASLEGTTTLPQSVDFTATGTADSRTASLVILSGDEQSGTKGNELKDPLVVIARSTAGHRIANVVIQFRSVAGTFRPSIGTQQPAIDDNADVLEPGRLPAGTPARSNPTSGQQIYVITGSNGEASVEYNVGQTVVARDVIAEVRFESAQTAYDFAVDRVTFKINGKETTTPPPTTQQPQQPTTGTGTLTVSPTTITVNPGARTILAYPRLPLQRLAISFPALS